MTRPLPTTAKRLAKRAAPTTTAWIADTRKSLREWRGYRRELDQAKRRIAALEAEVQETRRLNRRVAEITDVIEELLVPDAERDDEQLRRTVQKYAETM